MKDTYIELIVTFVFGIPLLTAFVDNIYARIIAVFWGFLFVFYTIDYSMNIRKYKERYKK